MQKLPDAAFPDAKALQLEFVSPGQLEGVKTGVGGGGVAVVCINGAQRTQCSATDGAAD